MDGAKTGFARRLRPLRRLNDDDLAAAAAGGDARAFGVIFERYHEPLYRYCAAMLGAPDRAAAALQQTMLAAMSGLKEGARTVALRPWLHRIAHEQSLALIAERGSDAPSRQRSALLLHEMNDLEYAEVAAVLGISTTAACQAVREARRKLGPAADDRSQPGRELRALYALPPGVAAAVLGAGEAAIGGEEDGDRPRHRVLLAFLVLGVVIGSAAALAALGTFDSGGGRGADQRSAGADATPVQVAPGAPPGTPGGKSPGGRGRRGAAGAPGAAANAPGAAGGSPGAATGPGAGSVAGVSAGLTSAASAYTTPGERIEGAVGAP